MLPLWYNEYKDFIENNIISYLENYLWDKQPNKWLTQFREALLYSVKGWKKIRSILALEFYLTLNNMTLKSLIEKQEESWWLLDITKYCLALEFVHAYSLVHDDLPCMDNDVLRRGQPTTWKQFGEYQWVLVWDTLNSLAFEVISEITDPVLSVKLSNLLSKAISFHWMIGWQVDDLHFENNPDELAMWDLIKLHNKKTWALIKASVQWWILVSGKISQIHKLSAFWEKLWLAFQIKDDLLDVEWTAEETGKSVWWEQKWFVHFIGLSQTKAELKKLIDECLVSAKILKSEHLRFLVWYIGNRIK